MKVLCHREGLMSAFKLAHVVVPARELKPVLRNLKAIADGDGCTFLATDLALGIRLELRGVRVEQAGEALLPVGRVLAILRESTDDELSIEASAQSCLVRGQFNEFEMGGEDPGDFPDVPAFSGDSCHEL